MMRTGGIAKSLGATRPSWLPWLLGVGAIFALVPDAAAKSAGKAAPRSSAGAAASGRSHRPAGIKVALLHEGARGRGGTLSRSGGRGVKRKKRVHYRPPEMPAQLELQAIDLTTGQAQVAVFGTSRPPESRLFVLTDERTRRFVPQSAGCVPAGGPPLPVAESTVEGPKGAAKEDASVDEESPALPRTWQCTLLIPRLYRRAALTGLAMEWGDRVVRAPGDRVQLRWAEARAHTPLSQIGEPEGPQTEIAPLPSVRTPPEGGPTIDTDTLDEEPEEEEN